MSYSSAIYAQNTTEDGGEQSSEVEGDTSSNSGDAGINIRNRAPQTNVPIASEGWAKADFTGFIDIRQRLPLPDPDLLETGLRFLTTEDFPPFNERDETGSPRGYHIDLARALCEELAIACTMKIVPFAQIPDMIANGQADAALAGLGNHPSLQDKLSFSNIYLQRPGRFVHSADVSLDPDARALDGVPVAVLGGTAHEAFLSAYFPEINRVPVTDLEDARELLEQDRVTAIFGDAFLLLPMVNNPDNRMQFAGRPYYDAHFFGEGMAIAFQHDQAEMRNLLNYGLLKLAQKGRMAELYALHFAIDVFGSY